jgi:transcriptional regulator with XRE-family HTH domain
MWEAVVLRQIMSEFNISGAELSRQSGVSYQQISKFRGGNEISRANFVKIVNALPEKARLWYLSLVFNVNADLESKFQLSVLETKCLIQELAQTLQIEMEESPPKSSADNIAAVRVQIDELKEMLSQRQSDNISENVE